MADTEVAPRLVLNESAFLEDLTKPSLHALSYALRHPDTWPEGFVWKYKKCSQCAMGLAHLLWNTIAISENPDTAVSYAARGFAMPYEEAKNIFLGAYDWMPLIVEGHLWWKTAEFDFKSVTPEMVADQIDAYLERAE
jgi:hypothetical protein